MCPLDVIGNSRARLRTGLRGEAVVAFDAQTDGLFGLLCSTGVGLLSSSYHLSPLMTVWMFAFGTPPTWGLMVSAYRRAVVSISVVLASAGPSALALSWMDNVGPSVESPAGVQRIVPGAVSRQRVRVLVRAAIACRGRWLRRVRPPGLRRSG